MLTLRYAAGKLKNLWERSGPAGVLQFLVRQIVVRGTHVVYSFNLENPCPPSQWSNGERLIVIGPDNLDEHLTEGLKEFLDAASYECISGVRRGDRLFIVMRGDQYLHRGFVGFLPNSRGDKVLGENEPVPVIAYCYTPEFARGLGLYRRALRAEVSYLREYGFRRVLIATDPANTSSRRGIERAGFKNLRTVTFWLFLHMFGVLYIEEAGKAHYRFFFLEVRKHQAANKENACCQPV